MQPEQFPVWVEKEFTENFRGLLPLANALYQPLFPLRDGVAFTGTDTSPVAASKLSADIIATFDEYIV
jgi:hypothetical protein